MKSPLRFITGLIRRRPVETEQLLLGQDSAVKDAESQTQQAPALANPPSTPTVDHDESPVQELLTSTAAIEPTDARDLDAALSAVAKQDSASAGEEIGQPVAEVIPAAETPVVADAPAKRRPRKEKQPAMATEVLAKENHIEQVSAPASSFSDEAVALDAEIDELRKQLTRKLQLQNAQLKKMLERFGGN